MAILTLYFINLQNNFGLLGVKVYYQLPKSQEIKKVLGIALNEFVIRTLIKK